MGDLLGSSRVSSQKQNRDGVVGAQRGQYGATVVERARSVRSHIAQGSDPYMYIPIPT